MKGIKNTLLTLIAIVAAFCANAQVNEKIVESMMTKRVLTCKDISLNAMFLIPKLYEQQKYDTLESLMNYWNHNCGIDEHLAAFIILYNIDRGTFKEEFQNLGKNPLAGSRSANEQFYRDNIIYFLDRYNKHYYEGEHSANVTYDEYAAQSFYIQFLSSMAKTLNRRSLPTATERYLTAFYAKPTKDMLKKIGDSTYDGSRLQEAYKKQSFYGGFVIETGVGVWIPNGALANVGNHPYWGFAIGGCRSKTYFTVSTQFRFGQAPNAHNVLDGDTLRTVRDYSAFYSGINYGYMFLRRKSHELSAALGVSTEAMALLDNPASTKTTSCFSFGANAGLGYKVFLTHKRKGLLANDSYLNLEVKYHMLDYINKGGTDMTGHAVTVGLSYGGYTRARNVVPKRR